MLFVKILIKQARLLIKNSRLILNNKILTKIFQNTQNKTTEESLINVRKESIKKNKEELLNLEIKKTEALRSQFLSNVSHELKTPLNSILSATTLLRNKVLGSESSELVGIIHHSTQQLNITLNNVLDYYKLTNNLLSLDSLKFDLILMLEEVYHLFLQEAEDKGLNLVFETSNDLPQFLIGDEIRLKQILFNLLENAVKFTEHGNIKLEAGVDSGHGKFKKIFFRISDNGTGISNAEAKNMWHAFAVGNKSYSRKYQGIGMGLVLTKKLCELMNGDIFVKETSSKGTTFEFHVLLESDKDKKDGKKKVKKILLVEDNHVNQKLTQNLLANNGFDVDVAENGKVAVGKFEQHDYDVILMDIQMPVMDGITASKKIRMLESDNRIETKVKIFALTANSQKQDKDECIAAGMDGYMSKPLNPKEISSIFDNI